MDYAITTSEDVRSSYVFPPIVTSTNTLPQTPTKIEQDQGIRLPLTDKEIEDSTRWIQGKLRLLQADDIAQIGRNLQAKGDKSLSTPSQYWGLLGSIGWSFLKFVWDTWSTLGLSLLMGKMDHDEARLVLIHTAWTTLYLFIISVWRIVISLPIVTFIREFLSELFSMPTVDASYFKRLSEAECQLAKQKLGATVDLDAHNSRVFDVDVARFLLQLSSLLYGRSAGAKHGAIDRALARSTTLPRLTKVSFGGREELITPGSVIQSLFRKTDARHIFSVLIAEAKKSEMPVREWAKKNGICFATASELQTTSEAFCGLFWEPRGKWVVAAFRGPDQQSFDEWATLMTPAFEDCSKDIPGFRSVHKGFKDRILPKQGRQPYRTIAAAIRIICDELVKGQEPGTKINIWFTGHSLGSATASIAYAKSLVVKGDLGPHALVRDGYVFGTPAICDVDSRLCFDQAMLEQPSVPRTLWRVMIENDLFGTDVPLAKKGDNDVERFQEETSFHYCHLGITVCLTDRPNSCLVNGDAVRGPDSVPVVMASTIDPDTVERPISGAWAQVVRRHLFAMRRFPVLGRFASHAAANYWEQLDRVNMGPCQVAAQPSVDRGTSFPFATNMIPRVSYI